MDAKTPPLVSETALEELSKQGREIYENTLKTKLEPEYDRKFIALHVDTRDYAVAASSRLATREILKRHPADGRLYIRKIGAEPEYGLAARLMASEMMAGRNK